MKITIRNSRQRQEGAILVYFIMASIFISAIASLGAYVWTTTNLAHRRGDMIAAEQFAEGGAVIACADLNNAYTNATGVFPANLAALSSYALNTSLTTSSQKVYQRTISAPFTNQTITAQIWVPNAASVATARVVTTATVGDITQTATVNLSLGFAYPAAIISVSPGTTSTSVSKSAAQAGNVVISGAGNGPLVVDGNTGMAVMANGQVNVASTNDASVPSNSISRTNENTANEIADLTAQGTNALFDFNRFIAVANATTNSYNTNTHNNHFANVDIFASALNAAANHTLEGVVVVDIGSLVNEDPTLFPNGINIHGTLFYNFAPTFNLLSKFVVTAALNINPANMTGFVATNPSTYPSGYPPTYTDPTKNPTNINIAPVFQNFTSAEDLPALMYSVGEVDIHGPVNISGVSYTPSYMEIENKGPNGTLQYFKGSLIMGDGIYYENNNASTSILSFSAAAIDNLSTLNNRGKTVRVAYWQ